MLNFSAFRRPLVVAALFSTAVAASVSPASARSQHGSHHGSYRGYHNAYRHGHARYAYRYVRRHFAERQMVSHGYSRSYYQQGYYPQSASYSQVASDPQATYRPRLKRSLALARLRQYSHVLASVTPYEPGGSVVTSGSSSSLVMEARPLSRRQSDRARQPVVRALHEHGAGAYRPSRHRLRHGQFVRTLRHARLRPAGRRHR